MRFLRYFAPLFTAALMLPVMAFARNSNEHSIQLSDTTQVGTVQLQPGTYKLEWNNIGPNAQVTILQGKKVLMTVPATIKTNDPQVNQDDVVIDQAGGNREILREIDFSHGKDAVILHKGS